MSNQFIIETPLAGAAAQLSTDLRVADKTSDDQLQREMESYRTEAEPNEPSDADIRKAQLNSKTRSDKIARALQKFVDARVEELANQE